MARWPRGRSRLPGEFKGSSEGLSSRSTGMRLRALPFAGEGELLDGAYSWCEGGIQTKTGHFLPVRNGG
ncbi:hypothetical protein CGRA01v4_11015 [Colletotrichum graminicola]|nr:hypothetical protein CGRA01v4_11015 [Colletotrichum graminicola]